MRWTRAVCKFNCSMGTVCWRVGDGAAEHDPGHASGTRQRRKSIAKARLKKLEERIYWKARHKGAECAMAGRVFELHRVFSCRLGDRRWRTELDFTGREPLDDLHRSTAFRAGPRIEEIFGCCSACGPVSEPTTESRAAAAR